MCNLIPTSIPLLQQVKDVGPNQETIVNAAKEGNAGAVANEFGAGEQGAKSGSDGTRPRSTVSEDPRPAPTSQDS